MPARLLALFGVLTTSLGATPYALDKAWTKVQFPDCPVSYAHTGGPDPQQVVALQRGMIHVLPKDRDGPEATVFLDLRQRLKEEIHFEAGMHGVAFHPDFARNRRVFMSYSQSEPRRSVLSEFTVQMDPFRADPATERIILEVPHQLADHFSGCLLFGPDGYLYWSIGDGGLRDDPYRTAQHPFLLNGKLLRLDINVRSGSRAYSIPPDNPFVTKQEWRPEVYAYGFRNIWGMAFDSKTGTLWAADVGQDIHEEVNVIVPGGNYGWSERDGPERLLSRQTQPEIAGDYIPPLLSYSRAQGAGICITGGAVYRGAKHSELTGCYLYGDWGYGKVWALKPDAALKKVESNVLLVQRDEQGERFNPTLISLDTEGEVLVLSHTGWLHGLVKN
jgi:glucose/arabinose dehydrogenase